MLKSKPLVSRPARPVATQRYSRLFPTLERAEIARLRRFGTVHSYGIGEALAKVGEIGHGLIIVLAGKVSVTLYDGSGRRKPIVTLFGCGAFLGELASLK